MLDRRATGSARRGAPVLLRGKGEAKEIIIKAAIWTRYGPPEVIQLGQVDKPTPKANEVLIRIHASTVATADCELRAFNNLNALWIPLRLYVGITRPTRIKILGQELAGRIEATGKDVTLFKPGDRVFAASDFRLSTNAEYICLSEKAMMTIMPANLTYEQGAAVPLGGPEAMSLVRQAEIQRGQKALVIGAGGTIGTYTVQLAKYYGAEVTAVDSTKKLDMLRSIGADHVIDYTQQDFTMNGETFDAILDAPGKSSYSRSKGSLAPNGRYVSANPGGSEQLRVMWNLVTHPRRTAATYANRRKDDLKSIKGLIEAGKIKPVVDRVYPLEQTAEAHRYVEAGQKKGNVVITVEGA